MNNDVIVLRCYCTMHVCFSMKALNVSALYLYSSFLVIATTQLAQERSLEEPGI